MTELRSDEAVIGGEAGRPLTGTYCPLSDGMCRRERCALWMTFSGTDGGGCGIAVAALASVSRALSDGIGFDMPSGSTDCP